MVPKIRSFEWYTLNIFLKTNFNFDFEEHTFKKK